MWIDEITDYLADVGVEGLKPYEIFTQVIPANMSQAVMLAGGIGMPVDPELPGFHKGSFQAVVRHSKSRDAEEIAQLVSDALETELMVDLDSIRVNYIRPRHLPLVFPRSDGDFYEAVVNFDLCFVRL